MKLFQKYSNDLSLSSVIKLISIEVSKIFYISCIIDYLRHLLFRILRVRKIIIFIDKIII